MKKVFDKSATRYWYLIEGIDGARKYVRGRKIMGQNDKM